jgi:hypothetical protein
MRLILTLLFVSATLCRAGENTAGRWEGSVQIPDRELKLIVDLAQSSGAWIGSIIIPTLNVKGAPLADITVKDSDASFALKSARGLQATFKAHLNSNGTLSGVFGQAGNTAPFVLKKIGPPQVELPPHSTAVAKEIEGEWKGDYEMFGYARHVTLKLVNRSAEAATADFVIVGKKVNNLPVDLITQEGDLLTVDSHETGFSYEGRFNKAANEINGTLNQGAIETPLVLRRTQ